MEMGRCGLKLLLGFEVERECPEASEGLGSRLAKATDGTLVRFGAEFLSVGELANVFQKIGVFVQCGQSQGVIRTQHLLEGAEGFLIKLVRFLKVAHFDQELGLEAKGEFHQSGIVRRKGVLRKEEHFGGNRERLFQISFLIKLFNLRLKAGKLLQRVRGAVLGNSGQGQAGEEQEAEADSQPVFRVAALDGKDGTTVWSIPLPGEPRPWGLSVDRRGRVTIALMDGRLVCLGSE